MVTTLNWQGRIVEHFRGRMGYHQLTKLPVVADHDHSQGGGQDGMPGGHMSGQSHDGIGVPAKGQEGWMRLPSWRAALALVSLVSLVVCLAVVGVGVFLTVSGDGVKGVCLFFLCTPEAQLHVTCPLFALPFIGSGGSPSRHTADIPCWIKYAFLLSYTFHY
jgi:hypothetical protein